MKPDEIDLSNALPIAVIPDDQIDSAAKQVLKALAAITDASTAALADHQRFFSTPRTNAVRKVVIVEGNHYEQRLNCCHKPTCSNCLINGKWIASHGPYWYLCLPLGKKWIRVYLGKHLDTNRFRGSDGKIDYNLALPRQRRSTDPTTKLEQAPGQLTLDSPANPEGYSVNPAEDGDPGF